MADVKKVATRESYGNALKELGAKNPKVVVLDADLANATKTQVFQKAYPDRFFDCGIAESNLMCVSAGLASLGLIPFASTFAMFAAGRAFEQVRNSIGYPHLNVKIGATHGGISVGEDGASHQCCEDFATMRSIPGMTIMSPSDDVEARKMVMAAAELEGPVYMRFCDFKVGKAEVLREGTDVAIIANGILVPEAMEAAETLAAEGISAHVINMHTIKPLDTEAVIDAAKRCGVVITVEEHSIIGGLGEAVASCLAESYPTKVIRIGVNDEFGHSGPAVALLKAFGLSAENIVKKAKAAVGSKENDALTNF